MGVEVHQLIDPDVLNLGLALTVIGILGKQACSLASFGSGHKISKLSIGIGMIPRGEVGLIFAMIGSQLSYKGNQIIDDKLFAAIVLMVILTTMLTPPALKWSILKEHKV